MTNLDTENGSNGTKSVIKEGVNLGVIQLLGCIPGIGEGEVVNEVLAQVVEQQMLLLTDDEWEEDREVEMNYAICVLEYAERWLRAQQDYVRVNAKSKAMENWAIQLS